MPRASPAPNRVKSMQELRASVETELSPTAPAPVRAGHRLSLLPFSHIRAFREHPFRLYEGERLADMVESIRQNGILMPLIVRRIYDDPDYDYEMLSGHNRMNAAGVAGLTEALCLVKEGITDAEALMYVIETNLMQRSFADLLPSEKAAVLTLRYSEMFSQGKRNDIIAELQGLESDATCGNDCHRLKSRDSIGENYAMKGRMVAYYLRVNNLIDLLKLRIDKGEFSVVTAAKLSYLSEETQAHVNTILRQHHYNANILKINALREADKSRPLTLSETFHILTDVKSLQSGLPTVKIKPKTYQKFFAPGTPVKEMEHTIEKALSLYFEHQVGKERA